MTKDEFISAVTNEAKNTDPKLTKTTVADIVHAVFEEAADELRRSGKFRWPEFGTFEVKRRAARQGRNPKTGDAITIPASSTVGFKPTPSLKNRVK